jgi:hypothetical protein
MIMRLLRFFAAYRHEGTTTPEEMEPAPPLDAEPADYDHPYQIPTNRKEVIEIYGDCGQTKLGPKWEKQNMTLVKNLPGSWNKGKGRMYCHKKMAPALQEALRRCEAYGVLDYIERMGCFKWRHIQHNPKKPLSYHSWGIAVDINPPDNKLKRYKQGAAPKPWSDKWWATWPKGVPEKLVQAFEESGFTWGGRWTRTPDNMHFQLAG